MAVISRVSIGFIVIAKAFSKLDFTTTSLRSSQRMHRSARRRILHGASLQNKAHMLMLRGPLNMCGLMSVKAVDFRTLVRAALIA